MSLEKKVLDLTKTVQNMQKTIAQLSAAHKTDQKGADASAKLAKTNSARLDRAMSEINTRIEQANRQHDEVVRSISALEKRLDRAFKGINDRINQANKISDAVHRRLDALERANG